MQYDPPKKSAYHKLNLARKLKLNQLIAFQQVSVSGSIQAAAQELNITQPALSKSIHELESLLEESLFIRSSRGVQVTDFGRMLRLHVDQLLADMRYLAQDLNSWQAGVSGCVVVGSLLTGAVSLLPRTIKRLQEILPDVSVQVKVGANDSTFPSLIRGELDVVVGLIPNQTHYQGLSYQVLLQDKLCAVVGRQNRLASQTQIHKSDLIGYKWIVPSSDCAATPAVEEFFSAIELAVSHYHVESASILTNLGLLVQSDYICLMPFSVASKFVHLGLVSVLPLGVEVLFGQVGYTVLAKRQQTPAVQQFLRILQDTAEDNSTSS